MDILKYVSELPGIELLSKCVCLMVRVLAYIMCLDNISYRFEIRFSKVQLVFEVDSKDRI